MWVTGPDQIMGFLGGTAGPEWVRVGVDAVSAQLWTILGVPPDLASRLQRDGVKPGEVIDEWWRAGVPLPEVAAWLAAGLTCDEALEQRADGVGPEQARAFGALRDLPGIDDI